MKQVEPEAKTDLAIMTEKRIGLGDRPRKLPCGGQQSSRRKRRKKGRQIRNKSKKTSLKKKN